MFRYERNFGSFYRNPNNLETVSILSKWVNSNTDLIRQQPFLLKYNDREKFYHLCSGKMWKSIVKNIFFI